MVESRSFPDRSQDRFRHVWRAPSASLHVVERFTRVDAGTIDYEATITDPVRFARPWTVRFTMSSDQAGRGVAPGHLFEYACHEGNYAIVNVLRGARVQEASLLCASMSAARVTVSSTASGTCCARRNLVQEIAEVAEPVRAARDGNRAGPLPSLRGAPAPVTA